MGLLDNVFAVVSKKKKKEEETQKKSASTAGRARQTSAKQGQTKQQQAAAQTQKAQSGARVNNAAQAQGSSKAVAGRSRQTNAVQSSNPRAFQPIDTSKRLGKQYGQAAQSIQPVKQTVWTAGAGLQKRAVPPKDDSIGKWVAKSALAGLGAWNKSVADFVDLISPTDFLGDKDPAHKLSDYYTKQYNRQAQSALKSRHSKAAQLGSQAIQFLSRMAPDAILAMMSGGVSLGGNALKTIPSVEQAIVSTGSAAPAYGKMTQQAVETMLRKPTFWTSFMSAAGSEYDKAKSKGASETEAQIHGVLSGLINAGIEHQGGIQDLPGNVNQAAARGGRQMLKDLAISSGEEGLEEGLQDLASNSIGAITYDRDKKLFSLTDEDALINPIQLSKDMALGTAGGAVMGGGQIAAGQAINAGRNVRYGRYLGNDTETVRGLIDSGLEAPEGTTANRYAKVLDAKQQSGRQITAYERGKMAELNELQMRTETSPAEAVEAARTFGRDTRAYRHAQKLQSILDNGGTVTDNDIQVQKALNGQQGATDQLYRDRMDRLLGTRTAFGWVEDETGSGQHGSIQGKDITLNARSTRPANATAAHEYYHRAEDLNFSDTDEAAADFAMELGRSAKDIDRLEAMSRRGIRGTADMYYKLRALTAKIRDLVGSGYVTKTGERITYSELAARQRDAEQFLANAINNYRNGGDVQDGGKRYSFAGEKAEMANKSLLEQAKGLETNGATPEDILSQTGWFKGADGKWRFEINDKDLEFNIHGFFANPDVQRFKELELKYIIGDISDAELTEMRQLQDAVKGVKKTPETLGDYVKHDKLFEAYPFLRDVKLRFGNISENGSYNRSSNIITINTSLKNNEQKLKKTLVHEIQHAIQKHENFARGASSEYWRIQNEKNRKQEVERLRTEALKALDNIDRYTSEEYASKVREYNRSLGNRSKDGLELRAKLFDELRSNKEFYPYFEDYMDKSSEAIKAENGRIVYVSPLDLYHYTAGEIEARDVSDRLDMTDEQRRSTFPESAKENPNRVFAEDAGVRTLTTNLNDNTISQPNPFVKKFSRVDRTNQTTTQNFKRWFGDWENDPEHASKVVNEDGTPKVVYHGTSKGGFTVFDTYGSNFGLFGIGSYFTESKNVANQYTDKGRGNNKQVYAVYLDIRNPIDMDGNADTTKWNKALSKQDLATRATSGDTNEDVFRRLLQELEDEGYLKYEAEELVSDILQNAMGFDGITHIGGGRVKKGSESHRVWIVFDPTQIKSATDNIGTFDSTNPDIRYSRAELGEIEPETRAAQNKKDKAEFGLSIGQYAREIMRDIGVPVERTNEWFELALRHAAGLAKDGQPDAARTTLEPMLSGMFSEARQRLDERDKEFLKYVRSSRFDLSGNNGELQPEDLRRFQRVTKSTTKTKQGYMSPDAAYNEMRELFPEYLRDIDSVTGEGAINPIREIYDAYDRVQARQNQPAYSREQAAEYAAAYAGEIVDRLIDAQQPDYTDTVNMHMQSVHNAIAEAAKDGTDPWSRIESIYLNEFAPDADKLSNATKQKAYEAFIEEADKALADHDATLPADTADTTGRRLSSIYSNTLGKSAFGDDIRAEAAARRNEFAYEGIVQKDTYEAAQNELKERGADALITDIATDKQWGADDVAKTLALAMHYQNEGDVAKAVDIISIARQRATKAGQASAMWAIVNRLTPEGQFIDFARQAENMTEAEIERTPRDVREKIQKEIKGKTGEERQKIYDKYNIPYLTDEEQQEVSDTLKLISEIKTKDDLIKLIIKQAKERKTAAHKMVRKGLEAQDIEFLKDTAVMQVFGRITDRMPVTMGKKLSTYQAISHLLNAKTMKRNIYSNAGFNTVDRIATDVGSIVDGIMSLFTKRRTVGVDRGIFERGRTKAQFDRARKQYLDIALAVDHSDGGSKYDLSSAKRTFKGRVSGGLERAMSYGLQVTDEWTKGGIEHNVKRSLERLKNSGFTDEEINEIAEHEAKYRTFQDDTKLSQLLLGLKNAFNVIGVGRTKPFGKLQTHEFGLGDFVQKYTQVPGALITRGIEFSPIGYAKAIYEIGAAVNNGRRGADFTPAAQRKIALTLGRAMTGTGIIAAVAMLSKLGIFTGERKDEDKKQKQFENALGIANFQINLSALSRFITKGDAGGTHNGDVLETIGFMEPLNTLMAMGNAVANTGGTVIDWANAAGSKVFDQIMDMSTMETIRSISNTISYGGSGTDVAFGVFADSATGFIPGPIRQLGSFLDPVQRNPYNEENSIDRAKERIKASIPGLREGVSAKINPFGEEKLTATGHKALDFFNAFLNPGTVNIYQSNDISDELTRLAEQSTDVLPHVPATSFTFDKEQYKPRGKEYEEYSRLVGTITADKMRGIMQSDSYKDMSDADKIDALSKAASYGEKEAKRLFASGKTIQQFIAEQNTPEAQARRATEAALTEQTSAISNAVAGKSGYGQTSMMLDADDFKSVKIDGADYTLSPDTQTKVTDYAQKWYLDTISDLESGKLDLDTLCGRTKRGKVHTVTDSDGNKVNLTGSYADITDDLVKAKIYKDYAIPSAKSHAIEYYADEIKGNGTVDAPGAEAPVEAPAEETQDRSSTNAFSTAKSSGRKSSNRKSGGKRKSSGKSGGAVTYSRAPLYTASNIPTISNSAGIVGGSYNSSGINGGSYAEYAGGDEYSGESLPVGAFTTASLPGMASIGNARFSNPFTRRFGNPFRRNERRT